MYDNVNNFWRNMNKHLQDTSKSKSISTKAEVELEKKIVEFEKYINLYFDECDKVDNQEDDCDEYDEYDDFFSDLLDYNPEIGVFLVNFYDRIVNEPKLLNKFTEIIKNIAKSSNNYSRLLYNSSKNIEVFKFICEQNLKYFNDAQNDIVKDKTDKTLKYKVLSSIVCCFSEKDYKFTTYLYKLIPVYYEHPERINDFYEVLHRHLKNNIEQVPMLIKLYKQKHPDEMEFSLNFFGSYTKINILKIVIIQNKIGCIDYIYNEFKEIIESNIKNTPDYLNILIKQVYDESYYFKTVDDPLFEIDMKIMNFLDIIPLKLLDVKSLVSLTVLLNNVRVTKYLVDTFPINFSVKKLFIRLFKIIMKWFDEQNEYKNLFRQFYVNYYGDFMNITKYILEYNPEHFINETELLEKLYGLTYNEFSNFIWNYYTNHKDKQTEEKGFNFNRVFGYLCKSDNLELVKKVFNEHPDIDFNYVNEGDTPFSYACESGNLDVAKWLYAQNKNIDISFDDETPFCCACENGYLEVAKWLLEIKPEIDLTVDDNYAFSRACENDQMPVVRWIYEKIKEQNIKENGSLPQNEINALTNQMLGISSDNEYLFRYATLNNNYRVAKFLIEVKPDIDITINNHEIFESVCQNNFSRIAVLLTKINLKYTVEFEYDEFYSDSDDETDGEYNYTYQSNFYPNKKIINWFNNDLFKCLGTKVMKEVDDCCICFEKSNVVTKCNHYICEDCLMRIKQRRCPYCRENLDSYYSVKIE